MSWPLYLALKQLFPTGKRVPLFTVLSSLGVALGVTVLIVTLSVMGGWGHEIRGMVLDTSGEIILHSATRGRALANPARIIERAKEVPEVTAGSSYVDGVVMVLHENVPAFPAIRGIDPATVQGVLPIGRFVVQGDFNDLDDDSLVLSYSLAREIGAGLGSKVTLYSPLMMERQAKNEIMLPREFTVVGLYAVGHQQLDGNIVICTLRTMQDLYGLGGAAHGVMLKLKPNSNVDDVARKLDEALLPEARAQTWYEANREFLFILKLEKNLMMFLLLFIVLVAGFSVAIGLFVSVVRKTREIGLLSALGADTRGIAACFFYQGFLIGVSGTILGCIFGFTAVAFRNDILELFTRLTQSRSAFQRVYMFQEVPAHLPLSDFVTVLVAAIVIATVAALLPAWRAARLKPSEALRSE